MKRTVTILLLSAILTLSGCTAQPPERPAAHTALSFSELPEPPEDAGLTVLRAKELLFRIENGELFGEAAQTALDGFGRKAHSLETAAAIAYVRFCFDVTDEARRTAYETLESQRYELGCVLCDAALLLSTDPALSDRYDAETRIGLDRADALSDLSVGPLLERERALVNAYDALESRLTVPYRGREWSAGEILNDPTLSEEDFNALYEAYLSAFNAKAGQLFLELAGVRTAVAKALGFDSYADYACAACTRDASPEEAAAFCERVRRVAVPVFVRLRNDFYGSIARLYGIAFEREPTFERVGAAIGSLVPAFSEPWNYMLSHGMYDAGMNVTRAAGSFTTYFPEYGAPFLFTTWTNGYEMPSTLIHEFGHFAAFYRNGETLRSEPAPDLAEIDSQGLELLAVLRYDTIYGELADAARTVQLYLSLYTLVSGCLEDEFERFAYGTEDLTLEALNAEYGRLINAYGLAGLGIEARSWTQVPQTFRSPLYGIGYAAAMSAAMELYRAGLTDADAAVAAYLSIVDRKAGASFRTTLLQTGLSDPFGPEWEERFSETLDAIFP
ncbi:MAG: hypothetical protein IJJ86_05665 [Clostridia bacterium]|nr:hypothetical protein [Clostridia bacterium]